MKHNIAQQRSNISRQFDKALLALLVMFVVGFEFALVLMLVAVMNGESGRVIGLVTRFADTLNYGFTTLLGFIGGIMTGKAIETSRASDKPPTTTNGEANEPKP